MRENLEVICRKEMTLKQQLKGSMDFLLWYLAQILQKFPHNSQGRSDCETGPKWEFSFVTPTL